MVLLLLLFVVPLVILLAVQDGVNADRLRRQQAAREEALRRSSPDALARTVQSIVDFEGWHRHPAGEAIAARTAGWTDGVLEDHLDALWHDCMAEDVELHRLYHRESNFFELHDSGLTDIYGEVKRRTGSGRTVYRG
jgi:hypothetical protein